MVAAARVRRHNNNILAVINRSAGVANVFENSIVTTCRRKRNSPIISTRLGPEGVFIYFFEYILKIKDKITYRLFDFFENN